MRPEKVEFKIQETPRMPWEMTQVHMTGWFETTKEVDAVATWLMRETGRKVRWNFQGWSQGHYIEVDKIGESRATWLREKASQDREFQNSIGRYQPEPEGVDPDDVWMLTIAD